MHPLRALEPALLIAVPIAWVPHTHLVQDLFCGDVLDAVRLEFKRDIDDALNLG